ncbi:MAG: hypothetical protein CL607_07455 [Anaerolineaceae bacterium]|nr:hypothetical protein [Anaerolineaceae bacterium]
MSKKRVIHESLRESFVPLPTDLSVELTEEQLNALFGNPAAFKAVIETVMDRAGIHIAGVETTEDETRSA